MIEYRTTGWSSSGGHYVGSFGIGGRPSRHCSLNHDLLLNHICPHDDDDGERICENDDDDEKIHENDELELGEEVG